MIYNKFNRNELRDLLKENILKVTFDKKNGEERIMTCTLKSDILPAPKENAEKYWKESETSLSVWDTNAEGWRAFCMDKIKSVEKAS